MFPIKIILVSSLIAFLSAAQGSVQEPAKPPAPAAIHHRFACTDYTGGKVFIVAADGKIEWEFPAATCNDIWALPNGHLLFNDGKSVKEVSRDKKIAWSYEGQACKSMTSTPS